MVVIQLFFLFPLADRKRQRAGALQDVFARFASQGKRFASWTAVALHRFSPVMPQFLLEQQIFIYLWHEAHPVKV
jgi:hypothetical protein